MCLLSGETGGAVVGGGVVGPAIHKTTKYMSVSSIRYRGYYTVVRRYKFYFRVTQNDDYLQNNCACREMVARAKTSLKIITCESLFETDKYVHKSIRTAVKMTSLS